MEAIRHGFSVYFVSLPDLLERLVQAQAENRMRKKMAHLCKCRLLVLDEIGYRSLDKQATTCLFQLISERYERGSMIDNINYRLDSGDLCKALTETTHGDRILGQSQTINLPVRCAWIVTGNNIQLGGDMPRRCYWIRMDAKCSKPFQRTGFKHKRLKEYVLKHRGELLAALLTLARAWFVAGRPEPSLTPVGSFEDWSVIIGGILQRAGIGGFLANSDQSYDQADIDTVKWEAFLKTLDTVFYSEPFIVSQVWERMNDRTWNETTRQSQLSDRAEGLRAALPDFIAQAMDREGFFKQRRGFALGERLGRRYDDSQVRIERDVQDRHGKVARWKVLLND